MAVRAPRRHFLLFCVTSSFSSGLWEYEHRLLQTFPKAFQPPLPSFNAGSSVMARKKRFRFGSFLQQSGLQQSARAPHRPRSKSPGAQRRLTLHLEKLEDRYLMDAAGFVNTDPPEDPDSIVGVAGIEAVDDYVRAGTATQQLRIDVLSNDPLPEGSESLRIKSVSKTARGATVTISEDGKRINYQPPESGISFDSFYYIVEDDSGKLGKANVSVGVKPVGSGSYRDMPLPSSRDFFQILEDSNEQELDVLRNDADYHNAIDFRDGEIIEVTAASRGTVRIADDGKSLFYQPYFAESGADPLQYTVRNDSGDTLTVSVSIKIVKPYEIVRDGDSRLTGLFLRDIDTGPHRFNLLANDRLRGPVSQTPEIVETSILDYAGELRITNNGQSVVFEPNASFLGHTNYSYLVRYGQLDHQTVTGSGTIQIRNTFLAVDNWFAVEPASESQVLDVLANDPAFEHFYQAAVQLKIASVTAGSHQGQISISSDGESLRYQPAASFTGEETFSYTVEDSNGHRDSATVTVHVAEPVVDLSGVPKFTLPGELEQFLIDQAVERFQDQFGVSRFPYQLTYLRNFNTEFIAFDTDSTGLQTASNTTNYSNTNTQEAGVDEADIVETDGRYLYTFSGGQLVIVDLIDPADPQLVSFTEFDAPFDEMYLQGDRLTLLRRGSSRPWRGSTTAELLVLDLTDRTAPVVVERTEIDGRIVDSRAVGDRVYVVVSSRILPPIETLVVDDASLAEGQELRVNETLDQYVARLRDQLSEIALPAYKTFGPDGELLQSGVLTEPKNIHKPLDAADDALLSLVTFDAGDDLVGPMSSTGIFTSGSTEVYMSGDSVYTLRNYSGDTAIFKFEVTEGGASALVATGRVDGTLLNQFSVDEYEGRLRIVTTETRRETVETRRGRRIARQQRRINNLLILEQDGADLKVVGRIEDLAPTETVRSVRFLDDRAYVVTLRVVQRRVIDPLFVLDLSDPTEPQVTGELKIPGFSDYLHPVGEDYVIGIGRDSDEFTGWIGPLQISLFFTGGDTDPVLADQFTMEGVQWHSTEAWSNHHAVAYFAEDQILSLPISWTETISVDGEEPGSARNRYEHHSAMWTFQIDTDGLGEGSIETTGHVDHATETSGYFRRANAARRSVRIGDALVTVSDKFVKVNSLHDISTQLGEVYLGALAEADRFTIQEDSSENPLDVRANDHLGVNGEVPLIVAVTQPTRGYSLWAYGQQQAAESIGQVEIAEDGESLVFTPNENFFGTASFTYTIFDELRGEQQATITVTVENTPDAVEAVDDIFEVELNSPAIELNVLANDVDVDASRSFGWSWFTDDVDIAFDRSATMVTSAAIASDSISIIDCWGECVPYHRPLFTVTSIDSTDQGGSIEIDSSGKNLIYTPAKDFEGIETFTYTITTPDGRTDVGTVTVQVGEIVRPDYRPTPRTPRPENTATSSTAPQTQPTIGIRTLPDEATVVSATSPQIRPTRFAPAVRKAFTEIAARPAATSLSLQAESSSASERSGREAVLPRTSFTPTDQSAYRAPARQALSPDIADLALQDAGEENPVDLLPVELTDALAIDLVHALDP